MRGIVWFRADLRIQDNPALYHAVQQCSFGVAAVYIIDRDFFTRHHVASCRVEFILRGLSALRSDLAHLNIPLLIYQINDTGLTQQRLWDALQLVNAKNLFFNQQYEIDEQRRDQAIQQFLATKNIACYSYHDQTILPPGSVRTGQNQIYKIFTPYQKAWRRMWANTDVRLLPIPKRTTRLSIPSTPVPTVITGFSSKINPQHWPAGEQTAEKKLRDFIKKNLFQYHLQRDFPALAGTSQLSPYLTAGMISPRQCFLMALKANQQQLETGNQGAVTWMSELIWRDFYKHLLAATSRLSMNKPYYLYTEKFPWRKNQRLLQAWSQGKTGVPIIDAAMRQLNTTGWMHNRLRMIVAVFLVKNLLLDWRLGEKYFMSQLIDGDLAANNGGWQWSASTGADALPYFRVFNPIRQSQRFDPKGEFIRQYCPELTGVSEKDIHDPSSTVPHLLNKIGYPKVIVNLEKSRQIFIEQWKKLNEKNE